MTKRRPIPPSEAQINAERLAMRAAPYSTTHALSTTFAWDYRNHIPDDLRGLVRAARRAYADEVPTKLHDSENGEGGTPRMTNAFVSYLDTPGMTDAPPGERPLASYHLTPFRATLDRMERGGPTRTARAAIVRRITIGGMEPDEAALAVIKAQPELFVKLVAEDALRVFFNALSDVKIDTRPEVAA